MSTQLKPQRENGTKKGFVELFSPAAGEITQQVLNVSSLCLQQNQQHVTGQLSLVSEITVKNKLIAKS